MEQSTTSGKREIPIKLNFGYALGDASDAIAYQGFSFLIFTFYYTVVGLNVFWITPVYILWSIYNSINDPLLGAISDRTRTRKFGGGRRRPWILVMTFPLAAIMIFLFTPPKTSSFGIAVYFFLIICLFDTFYTGYSLNNTSLYPEMFPTDKGRQEAGVGRRIALVVGLVIAYVLPTFVIEDMTNIHGYSYTITQYQIVGGIFAILILGLNFWHIAWGVREPPLDQIRSSESLRFIESLKITLTNKHFVLICLASLLNWFVFGLLPMVVPIYATYVLGLARSDIRVSLLLLVTFLVSAFGVWFWSKVDQKIGSRQAFICSTVVWIVIFIPLAFITNYWIALINFAILGFGFGGAPYFIDRNITNVIDADQLKTTQRREASYYGVHALVIRLSSILAILCVSFVLATNGWQVYYPEDTSPQLLLGLRFLVSVVPAVGLLVSIIFLVLFPLNKHKVEEILTQKFQLYSQPDSPK